MEKVGNRSDENLLSSVMLIVVTRKYHPRFFPNRKEVRVTALATFQTTEIDKIYDFFHGTLSFSIMFTTVARGCFKWMPISNKVWKYYLQRYRYKVEIQWNFKTKLRPNNVIEIVCPGQGTQDAGAFPLCISMLISLARKLPLVLPDGVLFFWIQFWTRHWDTTGQSWTANSENE